MTTTLNASTAGAGGFIATSDNSGILALQTAGTTALSIDASQNITTTNKFAKASMPLGAVLQVVNATYDTVTSTSSTSFVTTGLSASITPSSASNKVLVTFSTPLSSPSTNNATFATVFRGTTSGTNIGATTNGFGQAQSPGGANTRSVASAMYLDSPATTSSQTYTVAFRVDADTGQAQTGGTRSTLTLMEIAA
jgi:hypothetical protein